MKFIIEKIKKTAFVVNMLHSDKARNSYKGRVG